jgi:hypothetical protein
MPDDSDPARSGAIHLEARPSSGADLNRPVDRVTLAGFAARSDQNGKPGLASPMVTAFQSDRIATGRPFAIVVEVVDRKGREDCSQHRRR